MRIKLSLTQKRPPSEKRRGDGISAIVGQPPTQQESPEDVGRGPEKSDEEQILSYQYIASQNAHQGQLFLFCKIYFYLMQGERKSFHSPGSNDCLLEWYKAVANKYLD